MKYILFIIHFLYFSTVPNNTIEKFFTYTKNSNYSFALKSINKIENHEIKEQLLIYYQIVYESNFPEIEDLEINHKSNSLAYNLNLINKGLVTYLKNKNEIKARELLTSSYLLANKRNDKIVAAESLKLIIEIYQRLGSIIDDHSYEYVLSEYENVLYDDFEKRNHLFKTLKLKYHLHRNKDKEVLVFMNKHKHILETYNNSTKFLNAKIQAQLSTIISNLKGDLLNSKKLILKSIDNIESLEQGVFEKERLFSAKINLAIKFYKQKNYNETIKILEGIKIDDSNYINQLLMPYKFYWLSEAHNKIGNELISCKYLNQYYDLSTLNDQSNKAQLVSEYETKFQTAKKEKQNLLLQSEIEKKQRQQRNLWVGGSIILVFLSITGFLIYKNTKRKQLLAEQEKALESQKLSTVLKEQELNSIDAMIAGQEKERQRIANDLHDDLGSLMANVKLHFDALKDNPSPELYTKANTLIETAYDKIRGMAHAKNSGVMANKGLLKAINDIANSNSIANKLHIQVVDYGLEQQLENSLELTIFRIIQELIANIIKHAEASEATIHITNHEDTINLMVEDNGKGFDTKTISKHQGMGIHSIDKRIENLGGTVTIESEINKGTTVIIDIPTL